MPCFFFVLCRCHSWVGFLGASLRWKLARHLWYIRASPKGEGFRVTTSLDLCGSSRMSSAAGLFTFYLGGTTKASSRSLYWFWSFLDGPEQQRKRGRGLMSGVKTFDRWYIAFGGTIVNPDGKISLKLFYVYLYPDLCLL